MSNRLLKKMVLGWKDKRLLRSTCHDDVGLTKHLKGTLEPCPPGPLGAVRPGNGVQWSGPQSHAVTPRCQRLTEQNPKGHSLPSRDTALSTRILAGRGQIKLSTGRPGHSGPTPRDTSWTIQTNSSCEKRLISQGYVAVEAALLTKNIAVKSAINTTTHHKADDGITNSFYTDISPTSFNHLGTQSAPTHSLHKGLCNLCEYTGITFHHRFCVKVTGSRAQIRDI